MSDRSPSDTGAEGSPTPPRRERPRTESRTDRDPLRKRVRPDYRYSLANERTFLAWTRTGIAFIAGGVAVEQFAQLSLSWVTQVVGIIGIALGALSAWLGYANFRRAQDAMEQDLPLPSQPAIPGVVVGVVIIAALLVVGILNQ